MLRRVGTQGAHSAVVGRRLQCAAVLPVSSRRSLYSLRNSAASTNNQPQPAASGARALATGLSQTSSPVPSSSVFASLGQSAGAHPGHLMRSERLLTACDPKTDTFTRRHVGPQEESIDKMLAYLGYDSLDAFVADCVPSEIRLEADAMTEHGPDGIRALSESELLRRAKEIGKKNQVTRSFIGMGYHQAVSRPTSLPLRVL